jgi:hypothetical protein
VLSTRNRDDTTVKKNNVYAAFTTPRKTLASSARVLAVHKLGKFSITWWSAILNQGV